MSECVCYISAAVATLNVRADGEGRLALVRRLPDAGGHGHYTLLQLMLASTLSALISILVLLHLVMARCASTGWGLWATHDWARGKHRDPASGHFAEWRVIPVCDRLSQPATALSH
jgi:hypothetical protein